MSARIKMARVMAGDPGAARRMIRARPGIGYAGDPGLFSFIGKGLSAVGGLAKKILPGPIGSIGGGLLGAAGGALAGKKVTQRMTAPSQLPAVSTIMRMSQGGSGLPVPGVRGTIERLLPGGKTGRTTHYLREEGPPGPGYHLNKSGYYLQDGTYVAPQSVWVKNRRRNPLNPRALDRAIGRISSAKNASKKLSRITVRKACA